MDELVNIPALFSVRYHYGVTHCIRLERILAMHVDGKSLGRYGKSCRCRKATNKRCRKGTPQGRPNLSPRSAKKNFYGERRGTVPKTDTGGWPHRSGKVYERNIV